MSRNDLFAEALPLRRPWIVSERRLESKPGEARRLHLTVDLEEGCHRLGCPECDASNHTSVAEASAMLGENDTLIWRIVIHYVNQARETCN